MNTPIAKIKEGYRRNYSKVDDVEIFKITSRLKVASDILTDEEFSDDSKLREWALEAVTKSEQELKEIETRTYNREVIRRALLPFKIGIGAGLLVAANIGMLLVSNEESES